MIQSIKLRKPISQTLKGKIEAHTFSVGVIEEAKRRPALPPARGLKNLAGGPARKLGKGIGVSNSTVSKYLRSNLGFSYLVKPFRKQNDDAVKMLKVFFDVCFDENKSSQLKRLENLVQAIVRNPFTRGDYGSNTPQAKARKGFNRRGIDTGQLFNNIKAKVTRG